MATLIFCCGLECGTLNAHFTPATGISIDTTTFNNGLRSLRANASGTAVSTLLNNIQDSSTTSVYRFYVQFKTALPTGNTFVFWKDHAGGNLLGLYFQSSDSKLYARVYSTNGATGFSVVAGQWYQIDLKIVQTNGANTTVDAQINGSAVGQALATATTSVPNFIVGVSANVTADVYFDDFAVSVTSADYPIGGGKVLGFVPASDGTHTSTSTNIVKGTTGTPVGTAITSATTDSFNWVNARPIGGGATDATRLINQQTASSLQYVEHGIEQTTEANAPRGVEVLCIFQNAATQACNSTFKVNDNGTENTVVQQTGGTGTNADNYARKHYATMPADSLAWTLARFKALKLRFGYSSDATPDVYCRGWMVEADFAAAVVPPIPNKVYNFNQAVNRGNYW